jgi:hypothetical protein
MPEIASYAPGSFCWTDLASEAPEASAEFYGKLFGWKAVGHAPEAGGVRHWTFELGGREVAGLSLLSRESREHGRPAAWTAYVATADIARDAARSQDLGGRIIEGPLSAKDGSGDFARVVDPGGAIFELWQAKERAGAGAFGGIGNACWYELLARDRAQSSAFYGSLFGWTLDDRDAAYAELKLGDKAIAGLIPLDRPDAAEPSRWRTYFRVASANTAVVTAGLLGATVYSEIAPVEGVGWVAILRDPQGARFGIVELSLPA